MCQRSHSVDIVCLSHLWWDWVWQRPQHLMTRLARQQRVLYVEEPRIAIGPPGEAFETPEASPGLTVGRLVYRSDAQTYQQRLDAHVARYGAAGFDPGAEFPHASLLFQGPPLADLERDLMGYLPDWRSGGPLVAWLYTPLALGFIDLLKPDLVVYDVMDDLSAFDSPLPGLVEQQTALLARADLVFAGGPSIREGVLGRRPDTHLFPSGVEQRHFARAVQPDLPLPADMAALPRPIVGFFGVIDERTDLDLLSAAASMRPEWSWVLVGPVTKITPEMLPRLPNLHYVGKRDYAALPGYLKAFDVAMLPFALNAATRSISPTKTLEYLAAHKPVVSTPIRDVVGLYGSFVRIARDAAGFVAEVEAALAEDPAIRRSEIDALLARSEWDAIADSMLSLMQAKLAHPASRSWLRT